MKKAIVTVINDLNTDMRVNKTCLSLMHCGFEVLLIGRQTKNSLRMEARPYSTHRMRLLFEKGPLFYAEFNLRLFFFLLSRKANLFFANDLDTLLPCYIHHKFRRIPIIFDSHEYFTGVPELQNRAFVRKVWKLIEKSIVPHLKYFITVNDSMAELFSKEYNREVKVVRNIPPKRPYLVERSKEKLGIDASKKMILLQGGGINIDRGAEEAIDTMQYIENAVLYIIGGGDVINQLKVRAEKPELKNKVVFISKLPYNELYAYTVHADIGLSMDKDTNINYRFSLPNKLFDYIMARVPVLASRLPEIEKIVRDYGIGEIIDNHEPAHIASKIKFMLSDESKIHEYKANLIVAANELCWENEEPRLLKIISEYA